ncbi:MAG TPA: elongation factor G, partial [Myxococcales bacterium]|nr:elongation factor G [Myxococcales bacterium]
PDTFNREGVEEVKVTRAASDDAPTAAMAFKIVTDPYMGQLTYIRLYSGIIRAGDTLYNPRNGKKERVSRLLLMHANKREEVAQIHAGDIAAAVGVKSSTTGDTLCDAKQPVLLEAMTFPEPVIQVSIEPDTKKDEEKLGSSLQKLAMEDPSFKVHVDGETGQTIIAGMGELHLDIICDRLRREFNVACTVGRPKVAYRESITKHIKCVYKHVKQTGGHGQFAHVVFEMFPNAAGLGFTFESKVSGGSVPREYFRAVEDGFKQASQTGHLAGFPMTDIGFVLLDGSHHKMDSSEMAFRTAALQGTRENLSKAGPQLQEPIMVLEVVVPDEYLGDVMGDLNSR